MRLGLIRSGWLGTAGITQGVGIALLPKCPACLAVYAGVFGSAGSAIVSSPGAARALALGSAALCAGAVAFRARRNRRPAAGFLGIVGSGLLGASRLFESASVLLLAGAILLAAAVLVGEWPRRVSGRLVRPCCQPLSRSATSR